MNKLIYPLCKRCNKGFKCFEYSESANKKTCGRCLVNIKYKRIKEELTK
jgi:hypothetical protein